MKRTLSTSSKIAVLDLGLLIVLLIAGFIFHYISFNLKANALISAVRNSVLMADYRTVNQTAVSMLASSEVLYMELPGQNRIERERTFFELPRFDVVRDFRLIKESGPQDSGQVLIRLAYSGLNGVGIEVGIWILLNILLALLYPVIVTQVEKRVVEEQKQIHLQSLVNLSRQVAHDIRSPLSALEMALKTSDIPIERQEILNQVAKRIRSIADDLLKKSKGVQVVSAEKPTERTEKVETFEAVPSVLAILEEKRTSYPNLLFEADGLPGSVQIPGEAGEFERILSNLLQNAIEAVSDVHDPRVTVAIRKYSSQIQLSILDNGKGIPSEVLSRISEEGFSHDKAHGNGLGVSSAKRKVAEWGGKLEIQSRVGVGTMVTLQFATSDQLAASV